MQRSGEHDHGLTPAVLGLIRFRLRTLYPLKTGQEWSRTWSTHPSGPGVSWCDQAASSTATVAFDSVFGSFLVTCVLDASFPVAILTNPSSGSG